jgi:predicted MFS family arabinose efflux permease
VKKQPVFPGKEALLILVLFGALFLASVDNQLLIPLLPRLSSEFAEPIERMGWLFSLYALSAAVFNLILGPLTDRYGRVPFLRLALFLFCVLALLTAQSRGYSDLVWIRTGTGLAAGLLSNCTASFIGDYFPYERRGRVMGIVLSSYYAALIVGVPLSSWVAQEWGWRTVFFFSSGIAALLLVAAVLSVPSTRRASATTTWRLWHSYLGLLRDRELTGALVTSFTTSGGTLAFLTFISAYLNGVFGLEPLAISFVFFIAGLAAMLASPISGWLSDHFRKRRVFLGSNTFLVLPLLLLIHFSWGWPLFAALFVISLCIAFRQTSLQTLQTQLISSDRRGAFIALRNCFSQLGISVSVFVAGILYSQYQYAGVTYLAAGLTLVGSLSLFFLISEPAEGEK